VTEGSLPGRREKGSGAPSSEADLVRRCADGEAAAWEEFVDRFGPLLVALARRMLRRRSGRAGDTDVDEVVGEVFLALLRRDRLLLKRYDPTYRVSTYLGVICRTEVTRQLRRSARGGVGLEEPGSVPARGGPASSPLEALGESELVEAAARIRAALATLDERDRLLLSLRYLEGLDYRAIAAALDLKADSVGQLLHRAKERLARRVPDLEAYL
jgi:RNA polymerase sigma-70 factor (ECF subfamily)